MTLVELIFVLTLLATMFAIAAPRMSGFARGRELKEETRRFISLTRFARSEAASRAVPMDLWILPGNGAYGLRPQYEFDFGTTDSAEYYLARNLSVVIEDESYLNEDGFATITFAPDGSIQEGSLASFLLQQDDGRVMEIKQAGFGLGYYAEVPDEESR